MTIELFFDVSLVESHLKGDKINFDVEDEESTESTFYSEDCRAIEVSFDDDNSSMCSSGSEESMTSFEVGSYTQMFGDEEDSVVLAKGRYLHEEPRTRRSEEQEQEEFDEESEVLGPPRVYSTPADSTFFNEDCVGAFFEDDSSSMCSSSSSEESIASYQVGTYTRTFGDEDSLVLAKARQHVPEVQPQPVNSSRTNAILVQAELILEGLTIDVPNHEIIYNPTSTVRLLLNRRIPPRSGVEKASVKLQKGITLNESFVERPSVESI